MSLANRVKRLEQRRSDGELLIIHVHGGLPEPKPMQACVDGEFCYPHPGESDEAFKRRAVGMARHRVVFGGLPERAFDRLRGEPEASWDGIE